MFCYAKKLEIPLDPRSLRPYFEAAKEAWFWPGVKVPAVASWLILGLLAVDRNPFPTMHQMVVLELIWRSGADKLWDRPHSKPVRKVNLHGLYLF